MNYLRGGRAANFILMNFEKTLRLQSISHGVIDDKRIQAWCFTLFVPAYIPFLFIKVRYLTSNGIVNWTIKFYDIITNFSLLTKIIIL